MGKRNHIVSLIRVVGMAMILCCHLFSWFGISTLSQLFNVGIFVFLLISGWLYSNRTIDSSSIWLKRRWEKLCIPIIIWMILVSVYGVFIHHDFPSAVEVIVLTLNLQGIAWVFTMLPKMGSYGTALIGLSHLWFVTVIFLCYILLIFVKRNEARIKPYISIVRYCSLLLFVFCAFLGINIIYLICFFIGYGMGQNNKPYTKKYVINSTLIMAASLVMRLVTKKYLDGTIIYDTIVVGISHTILAIWILIVISYAGDRSKTVEIISKSKVIRWLDENSYYIYITHYFFLSTTFGLKELNVNLFLQLILFCVMSLFSALLLKLFSKTIYTTLEKVGFPSV